MKLWVSCECEADIFDKFREVRKRVENVINKNISDKKYDMELTSWDCIAIIRNDPLFKEIINYSSRKKEMDFRLAIDYQNFLNADTITAERLLFDMLEKSLLMLREKGLKGDGLQALCSDVSEIGTRHNWKK